jgi:hypothetical protein
VSPILSISSGGILLIACLTPKKHVPIEAANKNSETPRNIRDDFLMLQDFLEQLAGQESL